MSVSAVTIQRILNLETDWTVTDEGRVEVTMHEDYIRPQENGSHDGCDYVIVKGETKGGAVGTEETVGKEETAGKRGTAGKGGTVGLAAVSTEPFAFNASIYTQEELTAKAHNYELEPCGHTVLCLDYRQNGIGSNSCGPELDEKYRFAENHFLYNMSLIPFLENDGR